MDIPSDIPDIFKNSIFWPCKNNSATRKRVSKVKVPSVATSSAWQENYRTKENEKNQRRIEFEKRKKQRQETAEKKRQEAEEKKRKKALQRTEKAIKKIDQAENNVHYILCYNCCDILLKITMNKR